jgi:hypothetical protein
MSELSAAAAAALGLPEAIVQRSAAARAAETGMSEDDVLAAWAGGGDIPPPSSAPAESTEAAATPAEPEPGPEGQEEPVVPAPAPTAPSVTQTPAAAASTATVSPASGKPPVLVGESDNPLAILVGAVGLFIAVFLVGVVGPSLPAENPGARTSDLPYSETALAGQVIYESVGCASCHTQMVRPVVADVGLGAVSLNDSNQILGSRRFGPDLSNIGARVTASQLEATVTGLGGHSSLSLSDEDLDALISYLVESVTLAETPPGVDGDEEAPAGDTPEEEPATETTTGETSAS